MMKNRTATRLSPFAKPFILNRPNFQSNMFEKDKATLLAADESISFPKIAPLKLSTNISSAKNSLQSQNQNLCESDSDVDSPCWKGSMGFCRLSIEMAESFQIGKTIPSKTAKELNMKIEAHQSGNTYEKGKLFKELNMKIAHQSGNTYEKGKLSKLQVNRTSVEKTLDFDKEMPPEAVLFRSLWIGSEIDRCYLHLLEAGMCSSSRSML